MTGNGVKNYLKKYKRGCECGIVTRPKNVRARLKYKVCIDNRAYYGTKVRVRLPLCSLNRGDGIQVKLGRRRLNAYYPAQNRKRYK